ncbi:murein DD-endopeptidase MepM/ murein hydrolase activator NlpD [Planomicrobium stackebrandtii]|uniref:Murein DD-endopeptidase MepM/ murein hydrolase activator NlpD n=1 Tax=Planomicrobium stackebrandtii TaxID=253160 RepID=A0ABU0GVD4_9BACL|nr:peptidoglycan DD-metalloendopeptidase family protein [Planomicrobium stackebrandtii]MDQ0429317.1 murein DD-endopeptidase MepM/ murein hydrolase activator NlpD [Planomicrobium stackebrandtii]
MKPLSKFLMIALSAVLALTMFLPTANADKLSDLEKQKQEVQQKQSELNSGIQQKTSEISQNQTTLEKIIAKIRELDNQIIETQTKIDVAQAEIDQTKVEIDELRKSIEELERKIAEREELLKERARAIQLSGGSVDYIDVLLGANSFVDFIDRFSAVNILIEADREIMREQAADKKLLAEQKAEVETKLAEQEAKKAELVTLKNSLDAQKNEQAQLETDLKAEQSRLAKEKSTLESEHSETMNVSAELEKKIGAEQARLAEIARKAEEARLAKEAAARKAEAERQAAASAAEATAAAVSAPAAAPEVTQTSVASNAGSSTFILPSTGRFTSGFGGRDIGAGAESHLGMDIANSPGTPIVAAASGMVSHAGNMGGYGNVVILTHSINGQTHSTVYGHMNSINVSVGQSVSQGQQVGGMGNTGRSTGTHLHFEIHVGPWNGARSNAVNPAPYVR